MSDKHRFPIVVVVLVVSILLACGVVLVAAGLAGGMWLMVRKRQATAVERLQVIEEKEQRARIEADEEIEMALEKEASRGAAEEEDYQAPYAP